MNAQTEQGHKDLRNVLLNGRVLINGMPLTGNELGVLIQEEQMLYQKASQLDAANELVAKQKAPKEPGKKPGAKIVKMAQPEKK